LTALLATRSLAASIADVRICRDLNLTVECGSRWAILGRNGCGKTTLLKTLAGLHAQDSGEIFLNGEALGDIPRTQLARTIGIQFQEQARLFPGTALDAVLIGRHPHLGPWRWEGEEDIACARAALAQVGLAGKEGRDLSSLSGGEQQRLAIAALLAQNPMLYLLDEPSTHLDLFHQIHILRLLRDLTHAAGKALVMVLHDVNLAARFCDHALLLFGSDELAYGTTTEVLSQENLTRLYGHPIARLHSGQGDIYSPVWD
jgi:iron complex transport system ATP-binding protein